MTNFIEEQLMKMVDEIFRWIPQPPPKDKTFRDLNVIAHRGHWDNRNIIENTFKAFEQAKQVPICGIEFDIQWTNDHEPMIFHDNCLQRIFGNNRQIYSFNYKDLRSEYPQIPHFSEVIDRYSDLHLMIEIKDSFPRESTKAKKRIKSLLNGLTPISNYHLISLQPDVFSNFDYLPSQTFLPIAKTNVSILNQLAIEKKWGGLTGQYFLIGDGYLKQQHSHKKIVGTGFPSSLNCLFREANRNVDYIFTNHSLELYQEMSERFPGV